MRSETPSPQGNIRIRRRWRASNNTGPPLVRPVVRVGVTNVWIGGHHDGIRSQRPLLQEQILLHELNHRVNNEFAAAISIVSLAAAASSNEEVKGALSRVEDLLHRFADVHRALQMPECDTPVDAAAYLRQLCRSISRSQLDGRQIELVLAAQTLQLSVDHCWRLGMIVFELINNAARHAFPGGEGEIRVELLRAGPFA